MLLCVGILVACGNEKIEEKKESTTQETSSESTHSEDNEVNIGDTISYGNYNGNTEWIVLDKQDGKALLLSKYAIENRPYNIKPTDEVWETCTLRSWLNGEYLTSAFSSEEQARIIESTIINSDNPESGYDGGDNTNDKVFLLSIDEVNRYFNSDGSRKTTLSSGTRCCWWLRSPGAGGKTAAYVYSDGSVDADSYVCFTEAYAVRPALWINLKS